MVFGDGDRSKLSLSGRILRSSMSRKELLTSVSKVLESEAEDFNDVVNEMMLGPVEQKGRKFLRD